MHPAEDRPLAWGVALLIASLSLAAARHGRRGVRIAPPVVTSARIRTRTGSSERTSSRRAA